MVILGVLNTRAGIGIGRLTTNLIYGPIAFVLFAISGILTIFISGEFIEGAYFQKRKKPVLEMLIIGGIIYIAGIGLTGYNLITYNLDIFVLFYGLIIGVIWLFLGFIAIKWKISEIISQLIISLAYTLGLFYGAFLNLTILPIYIYFFFITTFSLQFAREIIKSFKEPRKEKNPSDSTEIRNQLTQTKLKLALSSQISAIIFFILPIFTGLYNPVLYLYFLIGGVSCVSVGSWYTFKQLQHGQEYKRLSKMLQIGILLQLCALLVAN
ncbi:MAG: hypothetical protein ACTSRS_03390 [Candidatus Helarchaeota archaeon]